ncbi:hypothetical protein [Cognatiyoonia sp. IB215182]|uniref:hypothetical protein n=1 Tax=Cognatiyoonia sp. IB215182 TaxID=3097353 RepID=UPI002A10842A|nr:hypothetical protein [Cognatiyoonia sp. IB215182]MDX8355565.1 hypothetical protein [Cognatiyoonia sp. IB215182]
MKLGDAVVSEVTGAVRHNRLSIAGGVPVTVHAAVMVEMAALEEQGAREATAEHLFW